MFKSDLCKKSGYRRASNPLFRNTIFSSEKILAKRKVQNHVLPGRDCSWMPLCSTRRFRFACAIESPTRRPQP